MRAIMELRGIGARLGPEGRELIDQWIKRNVVELSAEVYADEAYDDEHREFLIAKSHAKLGEEVSKHFNPYPDWVSNSSHPGILCRLKVLVFKNDFGLGKL